MRHIADTVFEKNLRQESDHRAADSAVILGLVFIHPHQIQNTAVLIT